MQPPRTLIPATPARPATGGAGPGGAVASVPAAGLGFGPASASARVTASAGAAARVARPGSPGGGRDRPVVADRRTRRPSRWRWPCCVTSESLAVGRRRRRLVRARVGPRVGRGRASAGCRRRPLRRPCAQHRRVVARRSSVTVHRRSAGSGTSPGLVTDERVVQRVARLSPASGRSSRSRSPAAPAPHVRERARRVLARVQHQARSAGAGAQRAAPARRRPAPAPWSGRRRGRCRHRRLGDVVRARRHRDRRARAVARPATTVIPLTIRSKRPGSSAGHSCFSTVSCAGSQLPKSRPRAIGLVGGRDRSPAAAEQAARAVPKPSRRARVRDTSTSSGRCAPARRASASVSRSV